jgi:hypothetical protein
MKDVVHVKGACQGRNEAEPGIQLQSATSEPDRLGYRFAGR